MISLDSPVENIPGIGPKALARLHHLNIKKIRDLLFYFPFRYEDFSNIKNIADLFVGEKATVTAKVLNIGNKLTWKRRMTVTEALLEDKTAPIRAVWFHQPYLVQMLKKGSIVNISGKVNLDKMGTVFSNPVFEVLDPEGPPFGEGRSFSGIHTGGLVAIYSETEGISSRWLRFKIKTLIDNFKDIPDFLPEYILKSFDLIPLSKALSQIHFPKNMADAESAQKRLAFQDLFLLQLYAQKEKEKIKSKLAAEIQTDLPLIKKFLASLPFQLTNSQKLSAWQILQDISKPSPMNRLLEGDVGSGKTVVATIGALNASLKNYQTAFLAPTEILAEQHFKTITKLLKNFPLEIALLTSAQAKLSGHDKISKPEIIKKVSEGNIHIIIGTHALIQKDVKFKNLALVVVDEQHRFGVNQRAALLKDPKHSVVPHLLSMTATPIPRTLALTLYGDLDLSLLKELPKGRKKIITKVVSPSNRGKAYDFIENQIRLGRQAFVICPLIEESKAEIMAEVKAATKEYEKLSRNIFPHLKIGLLHGKMKPKEKEDVMKNFKDKKINILVSTSVVEVGIDIPNASVMMIEGADRFGLSQLHQFRGRVGRAEHQSYCFLFTESPAKMNSARLKAVAECEDGFKLAEKDLQIRGPGQFFGREQSGIPDLAMSSLKNPKMIEEVQQAVKMFLEKSNIEEHPHLKTQLASFKQNIHWE
jgi:ATP-dependent DNA helicase RecG